MVWRLCSEARTNKKRSNYCVGPLVWVQPLLYLDEWPIQLEFHYDSFTLCMLVECRRRSIVKASWQSDRNVMRTLETNMGSSATTLHPNYYQITLPVTNNLAKAYSALQSVSRCRSVVFYQGRSRRSRICIRIYTLVYIYTRIYIRVHARTHWSSWLFAATRLL